MLLRFGRRNPNLVALVLFVCLTIIVSWPLPARFGTLIAGQDSDVPINFWANWWTEQALGSDTISLWETAALFFPVGADLTFHSFSHLNSLAALGLTPILGRIPAYNLVILLNFILNGLAMFQLARHVTGSGEAAFLAGIVFAFNSHSQYQSAHPVLLSLWGLPWATLFLLRAAEEDKLRWAGVAAGFAVLTAAVSTLLLILLAAWSGIYLVALWLDRRLPPPSWRIAAVFGGGSVVGTLPVLLPLLRAYLLEGNSNFLISSSDVLYIADLASPLIPHWYLWLVRGLYFGLIPLFLFIVGRRRWRDAYLWYFLVFGAYLLSIGPYPLLLGNRLNVTLPWSLPVVPLLRNPYRLNVLLGLGLALVVAYGWQVFAAASLKTARRRTVGAILCGLLIFGEYAAAPFPLTQIPVSDFYSVELADVADEVALAPIPSSRSLGKTYMYFQSIHGHPITGGAVSRRSDASLAFMRANGYLQAANLDEGGGEVPLDVSAQLAPLSAAGVGYLVLHRTWLADEAEWRRRLPFRPRYEDELLLVYTTAPLAGQDYLLPDEGQSDIAVFAVDLEAPTPEGQRLTLGWFVAEPLAGATVTMEGIAPQRLPEVLPSSGPTLFVTETMLPAEAALPATISVRFSDGTRRQISLPQQ
jgi:hypothetical protein